MRGKKNRRKVDDGDRRSTQVGQIKREKEEDEKGKVTETMRGSKKESERKKKKRESVDERNRWSAQVGQGKEEEGG